MKKSTLTLFAVILLIIVVAYLQTRGAGTANIPAPAAPAAPANAPGPSRPTGPARPGAPATGGFRYDPALAKYLPNPQVTPGDALDVTPKDFCESGYSSKVRDVPESIKNEVYQEYGITSHKPGAYEVDHLISLELGGSNSVRNLWPQSYTGEWNAHIKDQLENKLHELVCSGQLDMKTAQQAIATNWIVAYQKYAK